MLEKPAIQDQSIIHCVQDGYGVNITHLTFLPIGADQNTAAYRGLSENGTQYFVKLRSGRFDPLSVKLPKYLVENGLTQIIAPLETKIGSLWVTMNAITVILYPYVDGKNGYEIDLSERQWGDFGNALKRIHSLELPPELDVGLRRETYSSEWRELTLTFLELVDNVFDDPISAKLAAFLIDRRAEILDILGRAEKYAQMLQTKSLEFVLCHSDVHAGNILIDSDGAFYIVDWDDPILAPKERDLMFIGGGQGFTGHTNQDEELFFYRAYGQVEINPIALAYYRYERVIEDITAFCQEIFFTLGSGEDRNQAYHYLSSSFLPGGAIEIANQSDPWYTGELDCLRI